MKEGYAGKVLYVDLTSRKIREEGLPEEKKLRKKTKENKTLCGIFGKNIQWMRQHFHIAISKAVPECR